MITEFVYCTIQNDGAFISAFSCDVSNLAYLFIFTLGIVMFLLALVFIIQLLK